MNQKSVKDYYGILGVPSSASLEEIRLAYRRKARAFHPDLSTDPDAEERFKEVNEAYDVLANTEKRRAYDYFISGGDQASMTDVPHTEPPGSQGSSTAGTAQVTPPPRPPAHPTPSRGGTESLTSTPKKPTPSGSGDGRGGRRIYPPTWAILLIVLGGFIIIAVVVGAALSLRQNRPTGGAESVGVTKLTTFVSPPEIPEDLTVLQEDNTPLRTLSPTALNVDGTVYPVVAVRPEQGRWPLPMEQTSLAMWMHGTLINYVVGLPYTATTESRLAGLMSGDHITLTLESGTDLAFGSPQVKRIDPEDMSPLEQDTPGLTLMLLGSNQPSRLVVTARYLPEDVLPPADQTADGLSIRVLSADVLDDVTPETANSWYFLAEYVVTNTLSTEVDAAFFDLVLEDAAGQRYVRNEEATRRGQYGPLTTAIPGGATARGSAGYIIPRTVRTPLIWIFRADPTSSQQARLVLDFEPPKPGPALPDVELYEAFFDGNRDVIVVSGTVYNDGETNLSVTAESVELTSQGGASTLAASTPLLPWNVPPDDYQDFELQFSVPEDAEAVLLNVLGFTFQIEGLTE